MIEAGAIERIDSVQSALKNRYPDDIRKAIERNTILSDPAFSLWSEGKYSCFYAPFDWINEQADIVLIGITPGKQQAEAALIELQRQLKKGASAEEAARLAKLEASFKGTMRTIASQLMDHFGLQKVFGLPTCDELFTRSIHRAHFTSVLCYPVLETGKQGWKDFSGDEKIMSRSSLRKMIDDIFVPEIERFPKAWLVPFGPTPAIVLEALGERGIVDMGRVLSGLNHPAGTQWNRHNCQLDRVEHRDCAPNVGCGTIQERSRQLREKVASLV